MHINGILWLRLPLVLVAFLLAACGASRDPYGQQVKRIDELSLKGEEWLSQGDMKRAGREFGKALQASRAVDYSEGAAQQLNNLGAVALEQGDLKKARTLFEEALQTNEELQNWAEASTNQANLATVAQEEGDWQGAAARLAAAQEAAQRAKSRPALGRVFIRWGGLFVDQQDLVQARLWLRRSLPLASSPALKGALAYQWGRLALAQGDAATAWGHFSKALAYDREVLDRAAMAADLFGMGQGAELSGDGPEAFSCYQRAFDVYAALGRRRRLKDCLQKLQAVNTRCSLKQSLQRFEEHPLLQEP